MKPDSDFFFVNKISDTKQAAFSMNRREREEAEAERARLIARIMPLVNVNTDKCEPNRKERQDAETAKILARILPLLKELKQFIFEHRKSFELIRYRILIDNINAFEFEFQRHMKQHNFGIGYSRRGLFTLAPCLEEDLIEIYKKGHAYRAGRLKEKEAEAASLLSDISRVEKEKAELKKKL